MNSEKKLEQRDFDEHPDPIDKKINAKEDEEKTVLNTNENESSNGDCEQYPMLHNNKSAEPKKENIKCIDKEKNRKVSFPIDKNLVTAYFEPVNPWEGVSRVSTDELCNLYKASCVKHKTEPLIVVLNHLKSLDNTNECRANNLDLHNQILTQENVECLEEILKHVQYKVIDVSGCHLDDVSASAIFDMVEFYEAANELNISDNKDITNRGWQSSVNMIKRSQSLEVLEARGVPISEISASNLGKALFGSCLHTIKLEHCGMTGRPIATFCHALRKVNVLKELWLSNNDLNSFDAYNIGCLLKVNYSIQFLDISNNNIQDEGISYLADALIQQNNSIRNPSSDNSSVRLDYSELSASLNLLNNNKSLSPSFKKLTVNSSAEPFDKQEIKPIHLLSNNNNHFNDENQESEKLKMRETFGNSEIMKQKEEKEPILCQKKQGELTEKIDKDVKIILEDPSKEGEKFSLEQTQPLESFIKVTLNKTHHDELGDHAERDSKSYPERSFSSESLNSLTSIDSNDSKSSIRIMEAKFAKNGTLERQQSTTTQFEESNKIQTGLQILLLWNNKMTKNSSKSFSDLLSTTTILQILNIGRNNLGNDFLFHIKPSIKANLSLTSLGLQACHLSCSGIKVLAEIVEFGGNSILQRIDLRDNNLQSEGLEALNDALKSNRSITQIDLDDTPRKFSESFDSTNFNRLINNIRAHCKRNSNSYVNNEQQPTTTTVDTSVRKNPIPSRKISLTCQNVQVTLKKNDTNTSSITTIKSPTNSNQKNFLSPSSSLPSTFTHCKKVHKKSSHFIDASKNRLKSPLPSPIVSPLASPSRSRFQVSKVNESKMSCSSELSPSPTFFPSSRFSVTRVTQSTPHSSSILLTPSSACSTLSDSALSSSSTSLDSIDQHNELNISMGSTDSFDIILRNVPMMDAKYIKCPENSKNAENNEIHKLNDSYSSLEISLSSQESLDIPQEEQNPQKVSSNEGTLTGNSPCKSPESDILDLPRHKPSDKRIRKNSSNYPATLDKLLNLFQPTNISQIFNRSSPENIKKDETILQTKKENAVGSLFAMVGLGGTRKDSPESLDLQSRFNVLQQNVFSDNSAEPTLLVDNLPKEIKKEVKENISPDNTITASSISSTKPLLAKENEEISDFIHKKVLFELGDEDHDDISVSQIVETKELQKSSEVTLVIQTDKEAVNFQSSELGLGGIARDSLSIIKGGANTSQDSMRSLDSLPELEQFDNNYIVNSDENSFSEEIEKKINQLENDDKKDKNDEVQNITPVYY